MNEFQKGISKYFSVEELAHIASLKVGIAGAGGLGSNCAVNLVRSGFQRLVVADFDKLDASNLNRQYYFKSQLGEFKVLALKDNLLAINKDLDLDMQVALVSEENCEELFGDCDIIVEAFDKPESKRMMLEHFWRSDKLLVIASGIAGTGDSDRIKVRQLKKNIFLVGDESSDIKDRPPYSPCVAIAAAKQADIILSYALGGVR